MNITICGRVFDTTTIRSIIINETKIHIDAEDDFYSFSYHNEKEITDAKRWLKLKETTIPELQTAVSLIITVCEEFLSQKEQCENCPLKRKKGCVFTEIPINWR
jgi:hypothetical protein